ncbi:hypothetical protein WV31_13160 [Magnetospirillum sp. ME-1]|uniref:class I SAM-dependent methyltransferase n=1 Tax=Magnetospirillum sp. ME-1 TaxID=1639348 RepID=UPI000A17D263|nr:class I SAM-dependent methyltransferase [Magnetospirillum sp. ME-1]ARJ66548.1 hypothetical protein WV31_13160 [Magnetospirillum sp. ME-1]
MTPKYPRYQDYVIRDGRLVGEFEDMYRDFDDPWHQVADETWATERAVGICYLQRLQTRLGARKVVELGCGLGRYSARIAGTGLQTIGLDISSTAVERARRECPGPGFEVGRLSDYDLLRTLAPDVIVMAEITWYVLDQLDDFLTFLRTDLPACSLVHLLTTYAPGKQVYGRDYFTDLPGILQRFGMHYFEFGQISQPDGGAKTFFAGTWHADKLAEW